MNKNKYGIKAKEPNLLINMENFQKESMKSLVGRPIDTIISLVIAIDFVKQEEQHAASNSSST